MSRPASSGACDTTWGSGAARARRRPASSGRGGAKQLRCLRRRAEQIRQSSDLAACLAAAGLAACLAGLAACLACSGPGDGSCGLPGSGGQARRSGQHAHGKGAGSSQARWAWGRRRQGGTSGGKAGAGSPEARRREGTPTAGCAWGRRKKGRHVGELAVGRAGAARAGGREAHEGEKNRMNRSFSTNQWH
jgi:hypothetical protein